MKPNLRPARPDFSSGPCAKRPGWTPKLLKDAAVGGSHRSKLGKKKIVEAVDRTRALLGQLGGLSAANRADAIYDMLHRSYEAQPVFSDPMAGTYYELA